MLTQLVDTNRIVNRKMAILNAGKAASLHPLCSSFSPSQTLWGEQADSHPGWADPRSMRGERRRERALMPMCLHLPPRQMNNVAVRPGLAGVDWAFYGHTTSEVPTNKYSKKSINQSIQAINKQRERQLQGHYDGVYFSAVLSISYV